MLVRARSAAAFAAALLTAVLLSSCAPDPWAGPRPEPSAVGVPAAGFHPAEPPAPEATVEPTTGSWDGVHPAPGYRVVLLRSGDDAATTSLVDAVESWAGERDIALRTVDADETDPVTAIVEAMDLEPNLIVSAGNALIDPLALVSANHLDVPFLVVGAELAEPTGNVTAVDWEGAGFRGEGLTSSTTFDPATFTPERTGAAIRAGVTAVLTGLTGVVIWID